MILKNDKDRKEKVHRISEIKLSAEPGRDQIFMGRDGTGTGINLYGMGQDFVGRDIPSHPRLYSKQCGR